MQQKHYSKCLQYSWKVFILCRSLICFGFEPFRLEEQLLSVEGAIFLIRISTVYIYSSSLEDFNYSILTILLNRVFVFDFLVSEISFYVNPGSFSNSLQSDLLFESVDFGLKLPDLSRSELFRPFMLFFILNLSVFTLIWSFSDLICHFLCVLDFYREPRLCS